MNRHRIAALGLTLAVIAAGCSGGGSKVAPSASGTIGGLVPFANVSAPSNFAYERGVIANMTPLGRASLGGMRVDVQVRLRDADGLAAYARSANDPHSALYRQWLDARTIGDRFGASAADEAKVAAYFRSFGLHVGGWPQRLGLRVTGSQTAMERAFGTQFGRFTTADGEIAGPVTIPQLPADLPVSAVQDLIVAPQRMHRNFVPIAAPRGQAQGFGAGLSPQQVAAAFDYTGAYNAGYTGKGISVGVIGTGPIDVADFNNYKAMFGWTGAGTLQQVNVTPAAAAVGGGGPGEGSPTATPPPVTSPACQKARPPANLLPGCNPEDGEAQLDTEQAALARDANVLFYLAYVPVECQTPGVSSCDVKSNLGPQIGLPEADDEIQQAIADNKADVITMSYGAGERSQTFYFTDPNSQASPAPYSTKGFGVTEFAALAAEGIASFASSGDAGAQGCARPAISGHVDDLCVSYPASDQNVISVGGVTAPIDDAGRFSGPLQAWGIQTNAGVGGTGGGTSSYIPLPSWQAGPNITGSLRMQPDVSLVGDVVTGVATLMNSSFGTTRAIGTGGTSVASPQMAAMWALVLDACRQSSTCNKGGATGYRLGNPGPLLYAVYQGSAKLPYGQVFYDVTFGNNGVTPCLQGNAGCPTPLPAPDQGLNAGTGFDQTTGIGVPFARHLIQAVVGV